MGGAAGHEDGQNRKADAEPGHRAAGPVRGGQRGGSCREDGSSPGGGRAGGSPPAWRLRSSPTRAVHARTMATPRAVNHATTRAQPSGSRRCQAVSAAPEATARGMSCAQTRFTRWARSVSASRVASNASADASRRRLAGCRLRAVSIARPGCTQATDQWWPGNAGERFGATRGSREVRTTSLFLPERSWYPSGPRVPQNDARFYHSRPSAPAAGRRWGE